MPRRPSWGNILILQTRTKERHKMLIRVKYLGATNHRGMRLRASFTPNHGDRRSVTVPFDYGSDSRDRPKDAALAFVKKIYPDEKLEATQVYCYDSDIHLVNIDFQH